MSRRQHAIEADLSISNSILLVILVTVIIQPPVELTLNLGIGVGARVPWHDAAPAAARPHLTR